MNHLIAITHHYLLFYTLLASLSTMSAQEHRLNNASTNETQLEALSQKIGTEESPAKTTVLFAHGLSGNKMRKYLYIKGYEKLLQFLYNTDENGFKETPFIFDKNMHNVLSFNFPDVFFDFGVFGSFPSISSLNIAQEKDITVLMKSLNKAKNHDIIGFGVSRGAATWITALGSTKTEKNIRALVLESPFAHSKNTFFFEWIKNSIKKACSYFGIKLSSQDNEDYTKKTFRVLFQQHDVDRIQPIDLVDKIDKKTPILLIHSKKDNIIPINDSRKLYLKLLDAGHKDVYLVEFDEGAHACLAWEKPYGETYRSIVHAFFKKYNLPFEQAYIHDENLSLYQPTLEKVLERVNLLQ